MQSTSVSTATTTSTSATVTTTTTTSAAASAATRARTLETQPSETTKSVIPATTAVMPQSRETIAAPAPAPISQLVSDVISTKANEVVDEPIQNAASQHVTLAPQFDASTSMEEVRVAVLVQSAPAANESPESVRDSAATVSG